MQVRGESVDIIEEEKKYLKQTLDIIDTEIERLEDEIHKKMKTKISGEGRKRGEHLLVNSEMTAATSKINLYKKSKAIPYFGRIDVDFLDSKKDSGKFYIGRAGIFSGDDIIVTDWRAPISSLYYGSELGECSYDVPLAEGKNVIPCNLKMKRQITIENSKLIDVQDSTFVSNDDLLKPYLSVNADDKMKIIVASIQEEQNKVIRKSPYMNIIVQGVAGSGKTSVALHRIAYLTYVLKESISSKEFLILGPNEYFLNYISSVLPDLETDTMTQLTLLNFTKKYIKEDIKLKEEKSLVDPDIKKIQIFKSSLEYRDLIDKFMKFYMKEYLIPKEFKILDDVIIPKEEIEKSLYSTSPDYVSYERAEVILSNYFKANLNGLYETANEKYRKKYINMDLEDPERIKIVTYSSNLYDTMKKDGLKLLKSYIKEIQTSILKIYEMFVNTINIEDCSLNATQVALLKSITLNDISNKKVGFEDLAALMEINLKLVHKLGNYKQIVIDEAQDYGLFHYDVLRRINPDSYFAIYGDLAQSIYPYRGKTTWEEVVEKVFSKNCELLFMNKSYRTTIEITENANCILKLLGLNEAIPVIRHGPEVLYSENALNIDYKVEKINEMLKKGYKTIALICKTADEAKSLHKSLISKKVKVKYISDKDMEYGGGIVVLTSMAAKGLEFDGVILNDVSECIYDVNSDADMRLLYVASTRALHEMIILYDKEIVDVYKDKLGGK